MSDVVAALLEAHTKGRERVAAALGVLRTLSDGNKEDDDVTVRVAQAFHRFITFESPLHELDEEELVFPALRAYGPAKEVDAALTYVVDEHLDFDGLRERLSRRWIRVAEAPSSLTPLRDELLAMTEQFAYALDRHAEHEELVIFPLVVTHVPSDIQAQILAVMANRASR